MDVPRKLDFDASLSCDEDEMCSQEYSLSSDGFDSGIGETTIFELTHDHNRLQGPCYEKIEFPNVPNFMDLCNNNRTGSPVRVHTLPDNLALGLYSPPYKRVRALRLFDNPTSPSSRPCPLLEMSLSVPQTPTPLFHRSRLFTNGEKPMAACGAKTPNVAEKPSANVNPFTPNGLLLASKKRSCSKRSLTGTPPKVVPYPRDDSGNDSITDQRDESEDDESEQPTKKIKLRDSNISRYHQEFHEMCLIGKGGFGSVYKCLNRLDGCVYAVKKSLKPVASQVNERLAMCEVYALAVLQKHPNVVSYYSAWAEDDHMYIQNEYCNGGSLAEKIEEMKADNTQLSETQLRRLMLQVAEGLKFIHSKGLVHMDIKPANILLSRETLRLNPLSNDSDDDETPLKDDDGTYVWYKIGDFGHVTSVCDPRVEEGDCRYLPNEILQENYEHLTKADIFSLGVTMYEAGGGGPLPKNGPEWHEIRAGRLKFLSRYGADLNALLRQMVDPDPCRRPTASGLLHDLGQESKYTLAHQLTAERRKTALLTRQLDEASQLMKTHQMTAERRKTEMLTRQLARGGTNRRLGGKKVTRSHSTSSFLA